MNRSELEGLVRDEIIALHDFIAGWFRGEIANTDDQFETGFAGHLGAEFQNIQPAGKVLTKGDIVNGIRKAHGANPDFRISIHDVAVRELFDEGTKVLATYLERQTGARATTPADNDRLSTALMQRDGDRLTWLHLHETLVR